MQNDIDARLDACEEILALRTALSNAQSFDMGAVLKLLARAIAVNQRIAAFGVEGRELPLALAEEFMAVLPATPRSIPTAGRIDGTGPVLMSAASRPGRRRRLPR